MLYKSIFLLTKKIFKKLKGAFMKEFDFELWSRLAREDPDLFESLRKQFIEYEISKANSSKRSKLSGLQFQINMKRAQSGSDLGSCIKISEMMMNHLYDKLIPNINTLVYNENKSIENTVKRKCDVISLFKTEQE